ncbi:hypothetical protein PV729_04270 [Streptomyces europaeiscabiei]|uniref:Deoxynucleoside monophosphate kinase n=1 Tax=Streptomyces europaeiscabiei TaxID=146819 RepID=A0ABU4N8B9_9ACTN|nr:hypothetical protein [Streptomyces europaeiscabiei]MDX3550993.1 hypothetical protein [Streptomyces europaeiscabiei]MDX3698447.1 hypothetical protein [Streptomyces europaeiscabiei]
MRNIGLIGKARAGKDTAAAHLVRTHAYTRLGFADPLKEMALRVDPIIDTVGDDYGVTEYRLSEIVREDGWESAKDNYPEVRRLLQQMGQTVREIDEDFWLGILLRKVAGAEKLNVPVVVTDVRYRNEAAALRLAGFKLIRLTRPQQHGKSAALAAHASETDLDTFAADLNIVNAGSIEALNAMIGAAANDFS